MEGRNATEELASDQRGFIQKISLHVSVGDHCPVLGNVMAPLGCMECTSGLFQRIFYSLKNLKIEILRMGSQRSFITGKEWNMKTFLDSSMASMCVCSCLGCAVAVVLWWGKWKFHPLRDLNLFGRTVFLLLIKNTTSKCKELDSVENFILGVLQLLLNIHGNEISQEFEQRKDLQWSNKSKIA